MSWRPDDWVNPHNTLELTTEQLQGVDSPAGYFEAGADAMLEALREDGLRYPPNPIYMGDMLDYRDGFARFVEAKAQDRGGYLVFIPEDEGSVADGQEERGE